MSGRIGLLAVISLLVVACGGQAADNLGAAREGDPRLGHWILDSGTLDGADLVILTANPITMTLDGSRVHGRAACNSYSGTYTFDDAGAFQITDGVAVTEMWCGDEAVMESEAAYLAALQKVNRAELTSTGMVLTGGDAELRFVINEEAGPFTPPSDNEDPDEPVSSGFFPARTHGSWTLVSGELDGRIVPIVESHPILLTLGPNSFGGTVCNHYGFAEPFPEDGSFPDIVQTLMACQDDVNESEEVFLEALSRYQGAEVQGGQLTIRGQGTVLVFDPVSTPGTGDPGTPGNGSSGSNPVFPGETHGEWVLTEGELDGETIPMVAGHLITLTVTGSRLSGQACNEYWADVDPSGGVTDFATTRMACAQPIMDSEIAYLKALAQSQVATVHEGRLIVRGPIGFLIFDPA
jgi:heat shock protein HslJ